MQSDPNANSAGLSIVTLATNLVFAELTSLTIVIRCCHLLCMSMKTLDGIGWGSSLSEEGYLPS